MSISQAALRNVNQGVLIGCREKMAVDYIRLWKLLLDRGMKRTDLKSEAGISSNVLAKLGKNEYVSMETMEKICSSLNCNIEDIMEFSSDEES